MVHQFLSNNPVPNEVRLKDLTIVILNFYSNKGIFSKKKWVELKTFTITYTEPNSGKRQTSNPLSYLLIYSELKANLNFDFEKFNLYPMMCSWLDFSLKYNLNFHPQQGLNFIDIDLKSVYGTTNPIIVRIIEPTIFVASMMGALFKQIIKKRNELVNNSSQLYKIEWLVDFRNLISDTISLIDITFNRLHYKAEFDKEPSWTFDKAVIGDRFGRRVMDKINWVYKITGNLLDSIAKEKNALNNLKELRNQLMHFDPAHFEIKLKDLPIYFNDIIDIGCFICKIRKAIEVPLSSELIAFLLQPEIVYNENKTLVISFEI